jgi:CMP-N,N'-diacetyllegionaminic acid synthase
MDQNILGIIPARSRSKGVPDKNIRELAGKPLIHHTIEAAENSRHLKEYLVSTDSEKYAEIAESAGAPVPFIRPDELATDDAASIDVATHAVEQYERDSGNTVDIIVLLQPTTPLRTATDIDEALATFLDSDRPSLVSCYETVDAHPNHMFESTNGDELKPLRDPDETPHRRQLFDPVYLLNGALYICTRELVFDEERFYDDRPTRYLMPRDRSVNIDEPFDFELAELLMQRE